MLVNLADGLDNLPHRASTAMVVQDISKDLPVVDLDIVRAGPPGSEAVVQECKKVRNY